MKIRLEDIWYEGMIKSYKDFINNVDYSYKGYYLVTCQNKNSEIDGEYFTHIIDKNLIYVHKILQSIWHQPIQISENSHKQIIDEYIMEQRMEQRQKKLERILNE